MPGLKTVAKLLGKLRYVMSTDSERKRVIVINKYTLRHMYTKFKDSSNCSFRDLSINKGVLLSTITINNIYNEQEL